MMPTKVVKPLQKPHSKASHQPLNTSRMIDDKKSQQASSVQSKTNLSRRDRTALLKNASKKKDEIEKTLIADSIKQQGPKSKDTKTNRSLVHNKDQKNSKKNGLTPQAKKPITNIFAKKAQEAKQNESKSQLPTFQKPIHQKPNNQNKKEISQESDLSRTLSNDEFSMHMHKKPSNKLENSELGNNRSNNLMAQKNNPQTKGKNQLMNAPQNDRSETSKSSAQRSVVSTNKKNDSKPKSTHKGDPQAIKIPPYSDDEFKKTDILISQMSEQQRQGIIQVTLILMSWIWEAHLPSCKNHSQIDSVKCFRKLLKLYEIAPQIFNEVVCLEKVKFQPQLLVQSSHINLEQKQVLQHSNSYQKSTIQKRFLIQSVIKDLKINYNREVKATLIFLLFEIIIFNYDEISNLQEEIPPKIIRAFKYFHIKNKQYQSFSEIDHKILHELIIFSFSQLNYLKTNVDRSPQFMRKNSLKKLLWKFFKDFTDIFHHQIKAKQFINFRLNEALTLETSFCFVTEFTNYARRFPLKSLQHSINIIEFEQFAEVFIERVIEFRVYVMQLKDRQKNFVDIEIDGPNQLFAFNFDLPIYDWAILAIKSDERKTFDNLVRHCKKLFLKNLQKKSRSKYETFMNKPYVNDKYARFTIQELPEDQRSFYDNSIHYQSRKQPEQQNSGYKLSYEKLKGFVSIPHMNFLVFKEFVPLSVKRLAAENKKKYVVEKLESHLIYLLILSNSSHLLQLIKEIQCSSIEMLSPEIGKGLVRICSYCHEFKSKVIGQKFLKQLRSNTLHKQLTEKIFQKDNDYQRRLSAQMMGRNTTNLTNGIDQNPDKSESQRIEIEPPQVLEIRVNSCETMYFELIMEIENVIPLIKLDHYLQELLKKPNILRPDKFYVRLLQTQHPSSARVYFKELITTYINEELRVIDLMTYFIIFADYCLKKDAFNQMLILVQSLSIGKLIKFHSLLFSQTFTDQTSYRILIPDGISREQRFNTLTSAGYEEKTKFIDQHCSSINELILWRDRFKPILSFQNLDKYICIKCFFTIVHQVFSDPKVSSKNNEYLELIISKLKFWIQKDKIDELASAFHFLSLAFFPHQSSKINSNLSKNLTNRQSFFGSKIIENGTGIDQKMTLQILYIIGQNSGPLIEMFKNKQTLTIRCLGQQMRKRVNDENGDDKLDEMKRKQVMKMLNKMKSTHDYMIRCIIRFVENVRLTPGMLKNFNGPEDYLQIIKKICRSQHMQKDQKRNQGHDEYYTPKLSLRLSTVSSNNTFQHTIQRYLKKYNEKPNYFHERYHFLIIIRFIAQMWIQQKLPSSKDLQKMQNETKSKSQFIVDKKQSKTKDKDRAHSLSGIIPVEKIFQICIQCLNDPISSQKSMRECEMLKQKLVAFETLSMLFSQFTQKFDILKLMAPLVAKAYKTKHHSEVCKIIMELLMKNPEIVGKQEKDLATAIRLKALSLLIKNFKSKENYVQQKWRIAQTSEEFWFVIDTLVFDKTTQIRLFILKSFYSRQQMLWGFRTSFIEKLVLSLLITSQQGVKPFAKIAKRTLTYTLEKFFINNNPNTTNLLNLIAMKYFSYLVNFNTVHFLQKGYLKLEYKEFFMVLVDLMFDKKQTDTYLYAIIDYFKDITNSPRPIDISQVFTQIKWPHNIQIDFYMVTRPSKVRSITQLNSQNQDYRQLLQEIQGEIVRDQQESKKSLAPGDKAQIMYEKKYPRCNDIFRANINEALLIMEEVFLERAAKGNRKQIKTKKPQSVFRNFAGVINPNLKNKNEQFKNRKHKNEEKRPANQSQIEI